ncbi:MAG: DNA recombination protein RmuC [Chitinophagaceae bacterium]|nr:DNA recombination protein RmuC [Chitinophagaceae bacterium]
MDIILGLGIGIILTSIISWLLHKASLGKALTQLLTKLELQTSSYEQQTKKLEETIRERDELRIRAGSLQTHIDDLNKSYGEKLSAKDQELQNLGEKLKFEILNLGKQMLEQNAEKLSTSNEEKMKIILTPFKEQLVDFKKKVEDTYDKESKERFSLEKEVSKLVAASAQVSQEANNLTTALKGNNKLQGNWGEMILESLLENSGLTKGREYQLQEFIKDSTGNIIKDENGKGLQPDATIYYPDQRKVIVDSKVSLIAWDAMVAAVDKEAQDLCLFDLIKSIRSHIDGLSRKNYPRYAQALDYVLLFIPIEPAFLEAVKGDPQLWKYAYDRKILIVSPTNLLAVLKIIGDLWKVEQQNQNAIEIADKAGALYDKFVGFIDNMEGLGKKLNDASDSYNSAFKQLSSGRGNMIGRIEELKKMGANASKQLPEKILLDLKPEDQC